MRWEAIIFDLDGTLAASEPLHMEAWFSVLEPLGLKFEPSWFDQWIGMSDRKLAQYVKTEYHPGPAVEELQTRKRKAYHALARDKAKLYPGVEKGLQFLQDHFLLGLASSSSKEDASGVFSNTQVDRFFKAIVLSDDVDHLKPAPDCYLLAAEKLSVEPDHCLAIEDSPAGVEAAKSAGMTVYAVGSSKTPEQLALADQVFPTIEQVMTVLKMAV